MRPPCSWPPATREGEKAAVSADADPGSQTLAVALGRADDLGTIKSAVASAGLSTLFDGPASYTLLAPNDAAFTALGERGKALMQPEQKALLVAVLRNHLVPGHLTREAIDKAIAAKGGKVTMTTLGEGRISFAKEGDTILVTTDEGGSAKLAPGEAAASNGVVLPLDAVLLPRETTAAAQ